MCVGLLQLCAYSRNNIIIIIYCYYLYLYTHFAVHFYNIILNFDSYVSRYWPVFEHGPLSIRDHDEMQQCRVSMHAAVYRRSSAII